MISALYATLCTLLLLALTAQVIKQRKAHKVALGDGGNESLQRAIRAHGNASEQIPLFLLLLFALDINGAPAALLHTLGLIFFIGRVLHAKGLLSAVMRFRLLGMLSSLSALLIGASANMLYLPWEKLLGQ